MISELLSFIDFSLVSATPKSEGAAQAIQDKTVLFGTFLDTFKLLAGSKAATTAELALDANLETFLRMLL